MNYYHLDSDATLDYENVAGNRATGLTDTAVKYTGTAYRGKTPYNDALTVNATYSDEDFFGTRLSAQAFYNDFTARYGANNANNYQDISIAPNGTLLDQSQNESTKIGAKLTLNKDNLWQDRVSVTAGVDALQDETEQKLILTNRSWAPLMQYRSVAPFAQARVRLADRLNLSAGVRYEHGELKVDDFETVAGYTRAASFGSRRWTQTPVEGGTVKFDEVLPSVGLVYDVNDSTQVFANYAKGLGMPDVGGTLRAITALDQSVSSINLEPIVTDNTEVGVRYTGDKLSADLSVFQSKSDLGSTLEYDAAVEGYRAARQATDIKGAEVALRYQATDNAQFTASYAHTQGEYDANGDGVMVDMPARNISPDKLSVGVNYRFGDSGKRFGMTATHYFSRDYPAILSGKKIYESSADAYTLVDMTYKQPLGKGVVGLGINNLLNEEYDVFLTDAVLPTSDRYTGGRGRNYNVSYTIDF
ncbi:TonB-dependent receptor [Moraxella porci]|nr:TonB-dependent receptor [Moraxella porci]MDH2273144.1 TonB-dependent receptor [Moraxella porci]